MRIAALLLFALSALGQTINNPTQGPPPDAYTLLLYYDGSSNLQYTCKAFARQPSFSWLRSDSTLTNIIVATNVGTATTSTAHGLAPGNLVTVSGSTTSALNSTYVIQTVGASTTFTITTAGVPDATYNTALLSVATTAPRTTAAIWDIFQFQYNGSNLLTTVQKASGKAGLNSICSSRASLNYQ